MSVISARTKSSRVSRTPSILKKSTSLKTRISQIVNTPSKVRFTLPHSKKVRSILEEYVSSNYRRDYDHLLCTIRDSELFEADIVSLLSEASDCICILNSKLNLFVEALISVKWLDCSDEVTSQYASFLTNLVEAHNEHAKAVIDSIVELFLESSSEVEWPNGQINSSDTTRCIRIHKVLNSLISIVPCCRPLLIRALTSKFPFSKRPTHIQEFYLHNLFCVLKYADHARSDVLYLIISKLVSLDTKIPREKLQDNNIYDEEDEIFKMDVDAASTITTPDADKMLGHTLDVFLDQFFTYLMEECCNHSTGDLDWETTKGLYKELIPIFDEVILPTYGTHHVQFIMFFLCSLKQTLAEAFLDGLWKKVCNPNMPAIIRQCAVSYIASFVARATFISLTTLKAMLQELAYWIHSYIANQDAGESAVHVRGHMIFYTVCQSLFYLVTFRHRDLVTKKKNIVFLESLNLGKIVTSKLNPLRVCMPAVVQNFAAVTRKYQLAYCYTIMEHNARNFLPIIYEDENGTVIRADGTLDSYFPFDPYMLPRSGARIFPHYRDYQECADTSASANSSQVKEVDDLDDFLETSSESMGSPTKKNLSKFSYGSSPGFKFKH